MTNETIQQEIDELIIQLKEVNKYVKEKKNNN